MPVAGDDVCDGVRLIRNTGLGLRSGNTHDERGIEGEIGESVVKIPFRFE